MEIEAVTTSYRRWAPVYDATFGAFTRARPPPGGGHVNTRTGSVLEVGVGTGLALPPVRAAPRGDRHRLFGRDAREGPREGRGRSASRNVAALRRMDARELDFPDASFDTVVAMHVISVVPEPERVVAEMARVCRPGGEVLILGHFLHEEGALGFLGRGWRRSPTSSAGTGLPEGAGARPATGSSSPRRSRARRSACSPACGCGGGWRVVASILEFMSVHQSGRTR